MLISVAVNGVTDLSSEECLNANRFQPFRSGDQSNVIGDWLRSLTRWASHALDPRESACSLGSMRQAVIYPGEDGFWVAECPSLPGCISQGETREQAITNIREAIEGYVLALQDDGLPVPEEHFDTLLVAV